MSAFQAPTSRQIEATMNDFIIPCAAGPDGPSRTGLETTTR